jgi:serine/threonine protein phosphatase 1
VSQPEGVGWTAVWNILKTRKHEPSLPHGHRVYAIGDVHGREDLLFEVFGKIDRHERAHPCAQPVEIYLGDYVDRGPGSRATVDLLITRRRVRDTVLLSGNHETYILEFLREPKVLGAWRHYGGIETLMSYGLRPPLHPGDDEQAALSAQFASHLPPDHLDFYQSLSLSFTLGDFFFVHAGVRPGVRLEDQEEQDMLWIREEFLFHEDRYEKMIVHGHTPVREPEFRRNRINIDTGAYATGRLTCLMIEDDRVHIL